ncbi:MAG: DUF86 domain-containing protein [Spirochaetaceae bacterium]|nr:DUF86 domain-containing protein [Spirochaetaceae bacterium]
MSAADEIASAVGSELERFPHLTFAVLFGSAASGRLRPDSDVDVAVYGASAGRLEIEEEREIAHETDIQIALERATQRNVEILVLNRAPATVCAAALTSGRVVLMRDEAFYSRYFLAVTSVAIDFLQTEREYRSIRDRSRSLSPVDQSRLERIVDFIDTELQDRERFRDVTQHRYRTDRDLRRNLDRWVEILINAAIDIGKIVLSSTQRPIPYTYGQILAELETLPHFAALSERLQPLAALRNLMAHEYLDLRFGRITRFVDEGAGAVGELARLTRSWMTAPQGGSSK